MSGTEGLNGANGSGFIGYITNVPNVINDNVIKPTFNAACSITSTVYSGIETTVSYTVIKPVTFVAGAVANVAAIVDPYFTGAAAIGGTLALAKGVIDMNDEQVSDKRIAKVELIAGGTALGYVGLRGVYYFASSFFSKPVEIATTAQESSTNWNNLGFYGLPTLGILATSLAARACFKRAAPVNP